MRVRLLPSSAGSLTQRQPLTTFLVNERVAIDGGSIGFALSPEEMVSVNHIIVTHAHSDHTASLPIFVAEAFTSMTRPIVVHGTREVIEALSEHTFNDQVWPDFRKIPLMNGTGPSLEFSLLEPGKRVEIEGLFVTPVPVNHVVPTCGLLVEDDISAVVFTSDTYVTDEIWEVARNTGHLKAIFVDVSFPNELETLAAASKHFTPQSLTSDLKKLGRNEVQIFAVHIKPTNRDQVVRQLAQLDDPPVAVAEISKVYEW